MFLLPIKLDRVSFETKGRQNLQKTADESIVFCPLVPPSWISLVDPIRYVCVSNLCLLYLWVQGMRTRHAYKVFVHSIRTRRMYKAYVQGMRTRHTYKT